jgi:short-subunit dehydrogenase
MRTFLGKHAVVTGAASGIGRAISLSLAKAGCDLCLIDINQAGLAGTVKEVQQLGRTSISLTCNLAVKDDLDGTLDALLASWPAIDILVNNAGVAFRGRSEEMEPSDWERLLAVNLLAPIQITQRLLPTMLARSEAHVLNVCSLLGLCGFSKFSAYCASKFGLVGYSESLRTEYQGSPLGVTALCPGYVQTPFIESVPGPHGQHREQSTPRWLCTTPEVIANRSLKAIRRNQGLVVVTPLAQVLWRMKRFMPSIVGLAGIFKSGRFDPPASLARHSELERSTKAA